MLVNQIQEELETLDQSNRTKTKQVSTKLVRLLNHMEQSSKNGAVWDLANSEDFNPLVESSNY